MDKLFILTIILLLPLHVNSDVTPIEPETEANKLLSTNLDELILILTGDTQYYFPCTLENEQCKSKSAECREKNGLTENNNRVNKSGLTRSDIEVLELECIKIESLISNTAQRRSIYDLNRRLENKPKALVINGDLTNFGHTRELNKFKEEWMSLPLKLLIGLGNHDYENNIDDCVANQCANNMLFWFVRKYAPSLNLSLDYKASGSFLKTTYSGSFAYAETLCTDNGNFHFLGATCARVIQLNNRPDYTASVQSVNQWEIHSSLYWLRQELEATNGNRSWPVLINLHHLERATEKRIITILKLWMADEKNNNSLRKVAVFSAHMHSMHSHKVKCINGVTVPFMFVGSVPNNRDLQDETPIVGSSASRPAGYDPICECKDNLLNCNKDKIEGKVLETTNIRVKKSKFKAETVYARNNHIQRLSRGKIFPGQKENIIKLDLSDNSIYYIEARAFDDLSDLTYLELGNNKIKTIDNKIFTTKLSGLHKLFLYHNQIKKITPTTFSHLSELKVLDLDYNSDLKLPKSSFSDGLKSLEELSMDYCGIKELDDNIFENLVNLKKLSLIGNPLIRIPKAINGISQLIYLDLSNTTITEIGTEEVSSDHKLETLIMENMGYLYNIQDCAFCGLPNLKKLSMENSSHLYSINGNAFGTSRGSDDDSSSDEDSDENDDEDTEDYKVPVLTELNLKGCNFTSLPAELLAWEKIEKLSISQNPFECSCDMSWLINDKTLHTFIEVPRCKSPSEFANKTFSQLYGEICGGNTSIQSKGSRNIVISFVVLMGVIGAIAGFLCYTRRIRVTNFMYRPEAPQMGYSNLTAQQQNPDDDRELQDDFHPRPDAAL